MTGGPPRPVPLTLVTGPAGAGKTGLINAALESDGFADALTFSDQPGATTLRNALAGDLVPSGAAACLCCGGNGAFAAWLEQVLRALDNHRLRRFDRLIIETAAEADPLLMAAEVARHPYLSKRFALTGIIAVAPPGPEPVSDIWQRQKNAAAALVRMPAAAPVAALFALPFDVAALEAQARARFYRLKPGTG